MRRTQIFPQPEFIPIVRAVPPELGFVAVTGATGVLGGILRSRIEPHRLAIYQGDIRDRDAVHRFVEDANPDVVFHFAAMVPTSIVRQQPCSAHAINVMGTANIVCAAAGIGAFVVACSSSHVYRPTPDPRPILENATTDPATFYGRTKLIGEMSARAIAEERNLDLLVPRIFSFSHGSQEPPFLIPTLRQRIRDLRPSELLALGDALNERDIMDAESVIDALLILARRRATGVVNVGSGVGRTIADIAQHVAASVGRPIQLEIEHTGHREHLIADSTKLRSMLVST